MSYYVYKYKDQYGVLDESKKKNNFTDCGRIENAHVVRSILDHNPYLRKNYSWETIDIYFSGMEKPEPPPIRLIRDGSGECKKNIPN